MIAPSTWLLFAGACAALAITPGPNVLYLVSRTLAQGRPAGFVSLAGTLTGLAVHVLAAALGLSALLVAVPMAYDAVRIAGAVYLGWLAWQALRAGDGSRGREPPPASFLAIWRDGVATGLLNPKVALFQLALFPQFVDPSQGGVLAQSLLLGATQLAIVGAIDGAWILVAARVRGAIGRSAAFSRAARRLLAGVFALLALRLVADARH